MTPDLLISFVQSLPGCKTQPGLYIVSTPIGHLSDITLRALAVLSQADIIACEDTRITARLLSYYGIRKPLLSYHEHNRQSAGKKIITEIQSGKSVALVSDAGTPLISDPGFDLVHDCAQQNIYVTSIPGPSAVITALTLSGLPTERFTFIGFLSPKSAARKKELERLRSCAETLVLYEAPHRVKELLADMSEVLGNRKVMVARELTKKFEETLRGNIESVISHFQHHEPKGEFAIVIQGAPTQTVEDISDDMILKSLASHSTKDAAEYFATQFNISKKEIYQRILTLKK